MQVRFTTLCENSVSMSRGLLAEHGLAILVETPTEQLLFDTGQGLTLGNNAERLGKELAQVSKVVLSHGHYDHTGGLEPLLALGHEFTITAHPEAFGVKFGKLPGKPEVNISNPVGRAGLADRRVDLRLVTTPVQIARGVMTTGEVPLRTAFEQVDSGLLAQVGAQKAPDEVPDDLSLVIETAHGLVVLLGCAHRGMINHLLQAREVTGREDFFVVIGGAHLFRASEERLQATIEQLRRMRVQKPVLGHCTGFAASAHMQAAFGERFSVNTVGSVLELRP